MEKKNIQPSLQKSRENKLEGGSPKTRKRKQRRKTKEGHNETQRTEKPLKEGVLVAEATV
jgi:hypothetical protein